MINTSNEFKTVIKDVRRFYASASITLADNTILNLDNSKIRTCKIEDSVSKTGSFTIGGTIINKLTLTIDNINQEFSEYDFTDATIRPAVGLQLSSTIETLNKGVYITDEFITNGSTIIITALDKMAKFDKPFKDVTQIFPCTASQLLNTICTHCGVSLATATFTNSGYTIQARPTDDATTCREILSWIAQIAGCFARCNTSGSMELKWYDYDVFSDEAQYNGGEFDNNTPYSTGDNLNGGNFDDYTSGDTANGGNFDSFNRFHHIYSLGSITVATDDVVITGFQVSDVSETPNTVLHGQTGYVISIEKNYLIQSQSDAQMVANSIGPQLVGMRFRPLSITAVSDPSREAGDVAYVTDRKRNTYRTLISSVTFSVTQNDRITCDAESPLYKSSVRYTESTKTLIEARKSADKKITAYDLMVQQLNNLISHSFGVYKTEEKQPDGSVIYYMHDKPTLAESMKIWKQTADAFAVSTNGGQTYTAGFDVNGNAVVNVLSAIGINANWINTGTISSLDGTITIDLANGTFTLKDSNGQALITPNGVANSDNFQESDNIQSGFPLSIPFNIDDSVSQITKVLLKYTQQNFRTYSNGASSGGGSSSTSGVNDLVTGSTQSTSLYYSTTDGGTGELGHTHQVPISGHSHGYSIIQHSHAFSTPSHTHNLNFGIQESAITDYSIDIYVDAVLRVSINNNPSNAQGIIDLTPYVTTNGWHTIEISSTTLKRISAQVNLKSYIRR